MRNGVCERRPVRLISRFLEEEASGRDFLLVPPEILRFFLAT